MTSNLVRRNGKIVIDDTAAEFTEVGYDEPMRHMEDDIDVIARREIEGKRSA
ncbi:hypothetical protein LB521_27830 [Mesorhizobium sp. BR-1-1-8]|uniref:hypothetical protein n=1 Tax=unclassified Mesorhizobium TaxID=325217 RepID=UPI001CCA4147|nr:MULTISPECIES: hypothetical protein [unclassified Mesorhizobium]MBZ9973493.1 hypothetical protein [Mesorhizobium sp. BR1-1-12]MBZ9984948.1 hypothetical protein [Mesorhizobium sp. BR-1-1-8]